MQKRPLTIHRVKRTALRIFNKDEYLLISSNEKPYRHQSLNTVKFFRYNTLGSTHPPPYRSPTSTVVEKFTSLLYYFGVIGFLKNLSLALLMCSNNLPVTDRPKLWLQLSLQPGLLPPCSHQMAHWFQYR